MDTEETDDRDASATDADGAGKTKNELLDVAAAKAAEGVVVDADRDGEASAQKYGAEVRSGRDNSAKQSVELGATMGTLGKPGQHQPHVSDLGLLSSKKQRRFKYLDLSCRRPIFTVVALDDADNPLVSYSSTDGWIILMHLVPSVWYTCRGKDERGETTMWGLSSSFFFGFGHPAIQEMIEKEDISGALAHQGYRYKFRADVVVNKGRVADPIPDESEDETETLNEYNGRPGADNMKIGPSEHGCARADGFTLYKKKHKSDILHANALKAAIARGELSKSGTEDQTQAASATAAAAAPADAGAQGKESRRKVVKRGKGESGQLSMSMQYHIMKRNKPLARVGHSPIHQWGLFANVRVDPDTMVIEYLGEMIRSKVADIREKKYEASGIGSCYMFRIDINMIVDSTVKGNQSRFINHSCDPNCYTKVISVDGHKKIAVLTNRVIMPDEEITYDYFFETEEEKINCNCGADNCAGRLN